ncbi:uncharacterized protein [Diadema setosum]|uniref:uncharacterized protein n=1 Tax=Diadema setosum TaxID=31175 RepID=UPI003B3BB1F7
MGPKKCSLPYGTPPNIHESSNCSGKRDAPLPNVNYEDRKSNAEAMVVSFIAENNLPFTMTSKVLDLAKELSRDHKVLADLSLDRTSCTYKLKEGLASVCHKRLVAEMKKNPFSINIDECTAKNNKRVLSVLVSYFSEDLGMSIVHHYVSLQLTTVNANTVFHAVKKALEEDEIPFTNVVSSLSDSAAYMRGSKTGFEKRLQDVATNMLDIDGDLCHHIHNVVKKYCQHFDHQVEGLCDDLYNDFHYSPDLQEHLATISTALGTACKVPLERVAHRWLSSFDVTVRNVEMVKALTVFYYAWVDSNKQSEFEGLVKAIINEAKANKKNVYDVIMKLKMKQLTPQGLKRKKRIVQKLFVERNLTLALMHHYTSILPMFKSFVLTFEQKEPMIHKAHDSITDLFRQFLACFIKHEGVSELTARQLAELDISENLLKCSQVYVGKACEKELLKMSAEAARSFLSKH